MIGYISGFIDGIEVASFTTVYDAVVWFYKSTAKHYNARHHWHWCSSTARQDLKNGGLGHFGLDGGHEYTVEWELELSSF